MRSFQEKPPDLYARVSVHAMLSNRVISQIESNFRQQLRYRRVEYVAVVEWRSPGGVGRHLHLVMWPNGLKETEIGHLWQNCLPKGVRSSWYVKPVRNPVGLARYLVKNIKAGGVVPPPDSPRRIFNTTKRALIKPMPQLWQDIQRERQKRGERTSGANDQR